MNDLEAFKKYPEFRPFYNKLHISLLQGLECGTDSREISGYPKHYIIRPIINLEGMGLGAEKVYITKVNNQVPPGYFYQEVLHGNHQSFDFRKGKQILAVEKSSINKREGWKKIDLDFDFSKINEEIAKAIKSAEFCNVEVIGNKIIEMHARLNPDFVGHNSDYVIPIGKDFDNYPISGETFIKNEDYGREGFYIKGKVF